MTSSSTARVRQAILNTIANQGPYLLKTLLSRTKEGAEGSYFSGMTVDELLKELLSVYWYPFTSPHVLASAVAFSTTAITHEGILGVVPVRDIEYGTRIEFRDPKKTAGTEGGGYQPYAVFKNGRPVVGTDVTTLILGPDEDEAKTEIMWTVYPGDPIPYTPNMAARAAMPVEKFRQEFPEITHVKYVIGS